MYCIFMFIRCKYTYICVYIYIIHKGSSVIHDTKSTQTSLNVQVLSLVQPYKSHLPAFSDYDDESLRSFTSNSNPFS